MGPSCFELLLMISELQLALVWLVSSSPSAMVDTAKHVRGVQAEEAGRAIDAITVLAEDIDHLLRGEIGGWPDVVYQQGRRMLVRMHAILRQ